MMVILGFFHGDYGRRKLTCQTTSLVGCVKLCISSIQITRFFDYQYLSKKSSHFFSHGENPQEQVVPEATNFWLVKTCCDSYPMRFKDSLISSKTKEFQLTTLIANNHQGKIALKTTSLGWVWPGMPLHESDSKILWSSIFLEVNDWYSFLSIIILGYLFILFSLHFLSNIVWVNLVMTCSYLHDVVPVRDFHFN